VGGITGALLTGVLASKAVNPDGADGLLFGNPAQLGIQAVAVGVTIIFCFVGAFVLLKIVDAVVGLRVYEEDEIVGLDLSQHGETAYTA
jgi:Amt family ammonium transporter